MGTQLLSDKYHDRLRGVLHCLDRVIVAGNLHPLCYAKGMTSYLYRRRIRIFDYASQFVEPLRQAIRANAQALAQAHGVALEFVRHSQTFHKEERIQEILEPRGDHPGLVHIFSAMERCAAYRPWHDKATHQTYVKRTGGKCLYYYFYVIDEELGLCYLRVPTWCPFRLQFYFNGHNWLANQLRQRGLDVVQQDNAFVDLADFATANELAAQLDMASLHAKLDHYAPW